MLISGQPLDDVGVWPETQGFVTTNFRTQTYKFIDEARY
jgi:hypothetical protein